MSLHTFEDLEVWKRACRLGVEVGAAVEGLKPYSMQDQMYRAAISIPSNIAEGAERDSTGDFIRFLRIAKGSCAELRTQLYIHQKIAQKQGREPLSNISDYLEETRGVSAMIQALIKSLQASK
jgi:four helix bundle protein